MDILLGLVGKDYVMTVSDRSQARSIVVFKHDEDKIFQLDDHIVMATAGPQGDRANFAEYIQRNIQLYKYRNDLSLTTKGAANFTRTELATFLRKSPYQVNLLMGGYDEKTGPSLYYMDYMASMHKMDYAAHGYGSYFSFSTLDKFYKKNMTLEEGKEVMMKCIKTIHKRFLVHCPKFICKIVTKDGVKEIEL
ncbi:hypothetical protein AAMO2058_000376700 [Amorphochlora amoebiformis]|uniref:Proteasome subunit beta n=1 Tax=Amorphochlora amoebiformis TaxID=1561963 RepID=A0A7S0GPT9_9EUKA|mmetsp:Transcript_15916/g.25192  ORF Transcript_15916/g.25192 Transcript_15916/m.25192 type:complete len:193 (+) Transcript_15916:45-623(+)|eukprot:1070281-Amorphochlora_amoeboformis.AAC.2